MAAFALASSISPGPVNLVALSAGARYGLRASLRHVTGATLGFTLLLLAIGLGLHQLLQHWPWLQSLLHGVGVAFLLYMAIGLARDDGRLDNGKAQRVPGLLTGAAMQWLNPKAWLASLAGMSAFASDGEPQLVGQFAGLYFVICYLSIACWAYAGAFLRSYLEQPRRMRLFNRSLALLLAASALYLLLW